MLVLVFNCNVDNNLAMHPILPKHVVIPYSQRALGFRSLCLLTFSLLGGGKLGATLEVVVVLLSVASDAAHVSHFCKFICFERD
jgi:hypothetical protein